MSLIIFFNHNVYFNAKSDVNTFNRPFNRNRNPNSNPNSNHTSNSNSKSNSNPIDVTRRVSRFTLFSTLTLTQTSDYQVMASSYNSNSNSRPNLVTATSSHLT